MRSFLRFAPQRYLILIAGCWLAVFILTRLALMSGHWAQLNLDGSHLLYTFTVGLVYDLGFLAYACLPLGIYLFLAPKILWEKRWHSLLLKLLLPISLYGMLFCALAEWTFWDEFGVRFNFIAVDYLVYSKEVLENIQESYPIPLMLGALGILTALLCNLVWPLLNRALMAPVPSLRHRGAPLLMLMGCTAISFFALSQDFPRRHDGNTYQRELASNGLYQFIAAFRNNELAYDEFYATLPEPQLAPVIRQELSEPHAQFLGKDPLDIRRHISPMGAPKQHNIVLVTIESLSAKYLGSFGDTRNLTPNLDQLRPQSWFFNQFYATGTRTDRGLEAITLSVPPTPGRSIVKRIGHESGFASLGQQLKAQGYDSVFLYGGMGYFDNMNAFFGGNGYRVLDQTDIPQEEIHFQNAWGVADEDLYAQALKVADADHAQGKPFLLQLMTTSNHRPYTYPDGRIDIASGEGREGAVKYTDWAIGEFLKAARTKPWFDNTLFVFVADHCAGSAGSEDLPVENYHIPLFVYAPKLIPAHEDSRLASQIDVAPTLLGLLQVDYVSSFFGRNLTQKTKLPPRVLIGNYQHLGLFDGKSLSILSPLQGMRIRQGAQEQSSNAEASLMQRNISYYQTASMDYHRHRLDWQPEIHPEHGHRVALQP